MEALIYRSAPASIGLGAPGLASIGTEAGTTTPTLYGQVPLNRWTEIDSLIEGNFMERLAPGAFLRTMLDDRHSMRVLFQHGLDPTIGKKPLGSMYQLREDAIAAHFEASLFDTAYVAELLPALRAGQFGTSFAARLERGGVDERLRPGRSAYNPKGLPERTIRELRVLEFSAVTFAAYPGATATVRSLTDWVRGEVEAVA